MKSLIVEDDQLLANSLKELLEGQNYQVDTVYDGEMGAEYALLGIHALLRRQGAQVDELTFGNTALDLSTSMLVCGDKQIRLSAKEFDIMRYLFQSGEKNLAKDTILARVWGYDSDAVENHVEVYVGFLRKKLRSIGSNVQIQAVRRLGYHLEVKEL